jgi:hypothetical protein
MKQVSDAEGLVSRAGFVFEDELTVRTREEVSTMMDLSSFVDGGLAILGMAASILLAGWTITSHSSTVSAPESAYLDHQAFDQEQLKNAS